MDALRVAVVVWLALLVLHEVVQAVGGKGLGARLHVGIAVAAPYSQELAAALIALWCAGELIRFMRKELF